MLFRATIAGLKLLDNEGQFNQSCPPPPIGQDQKLAAPARSEPHKFSMTWADAFKEWLETLQRLKILRFADIHEPLNALRPLGPKKLVTDCGCHPVDSPYQHYISFFSSNNSQSWLREVTLMDETPDQRVKDELHLQWLRDATHRRRQAIHTY